MSRVSDAEMREVSIENKEVDRLTDELARVKRRLCGNAVGRERVELLHEMRSLAYELREYVIFAAMNEVLRSKLT
jgi:oligoribonuclease (3'-5' exoribonuclease)